MVCKAFKGPRSLPPEVRSKALHLTRSRYGPSLAPKKISGRALGAQETGARILLLGGGAGATISGEAADQRRSPAHHRQPVPTAN